MVCKIAFVTRPSTAVDSKHVMTYYYLYIIISERNPRPHHKNN